MPSDPDETPTIGVPEIEPPPRHEPGTWSRGGGIWTGTELGRFIVLGELGRGGMGIVLHAYDPKLEREVALKLVRTDTLGDEAQSRLVVEARAMAQLTHPNVVVVHDVETLSEPTLGSVVALIMEYVPGLTLAKWVERHPRSWQQIVEVYVAAGRGLAAAHAQKLLHRDFKPANVLLSLTVDERDPPAQVKVTDFGLAKQQAGPAMLSGRGASIDLDSSDSLNAAHSVDPLTRAGVLLGTPRYMAPEQHRGEALDAAADQYAFCVAMWESLCGAAPFRGRKMAHQKETGPPGWPPEASVPKRLREIVARGLAPNPGDRWPSMEALLAALQARPHRRWLAGAAVVLVAGAAAFVSARDDRRCTGARDQLVGTWDEQRRDTVSAVMLATKMTYAPRSTKRATQRLDDYADAWVQMYEAACTATTIRGEQSAAVLDLQMACLERARVAMQAASDVLAGADAAVVAKAHEVVAGLPALDACARIDELVQDQLEPPRAAEADAVDRIRALESHVRSLIAAGRFDDAAVAASNAERLAEGLTYAPVRPRLQVLRGALASAQRDPEQAVEAFRAGLGPAIMQRQWDLAREASLGLVLELSHRLGQVERGLEHRVLAESLAEGHPRGRADVHQAVALALDTRGDYAEAEAEQRKSVELMRSVVGDDSWEVMLREANLALILTSAGRVEEARALYLEVLEAGIAELGEAHPVVADVRQNYGTCLAHSGMYAEAVVQHRKAYEVAAATYGPDHLYTAGALANEGAALLWQGKIREAEGPLLRALKIWERDNPEHHDIANIRNNYAVLLWQDGRLAEAETQMRQVLQTRRETQGEEHPDQAAGLTNLSAILAEQEKYEEAVVAGRKALELLLARVDPQHPKVAYARANLGAALLHTGESAEAREILQLAFERLDEPGTGIEARAEVALLLADAIWATDGDRERARELATEAEAGFTSVGEGYADKRKLARDWLAEHRGP